MFLQFIMPRMLHLDPNEFLLDCFRLGRLVYKSGFRPKHAISLWRGGTPVGLGVDAFFRSRGVIINHTTIATNSYISIGEQTEVTVKNLEHLVQQVCPEDGLLIIDDVYESGRTVSKVVEFLRRMARANTPVDIRIAAVHYKPGQYQKTDLPLIFLHKIDADVWIDYPHELADLVDPDDPNDTKIRKKNEEVWKILRDGPTQPTEIKTDDKEYIYLSAKELLHDCIRLGVNISHDNTWHPNFIVALWPGGVLAGLPVHEVYKYGLKKNNIKDCSAPDHISINTSPTHASYQNEVIGLHYLVDRINKDDNILIIDTTFRAGRLVNDVVIRLKEALRRNLNLKNIRVASVYYNPKDDATWTVRPDIKKPDYYVKKVNAEIIYPSSVYKLPDVHADLKRLNPKLWHVLFEEEF